MLRWRLLLGTLLIAALAGLCWRDMRAAVPGIWLLPVAGVLALLASQEILRLARAGGVRPLAWPIYLGNLLLVISPWFDGAGASLAWPLAVGVLLIFFGEMLRYEKPGGATANIAAAVLALVYVGVLLAFAVRLRLDFGMGALASWIITVKMGDIGAYTVGRLVGRHKLAPRLSPGKTIEGAVGAAAFACLGAWVSFTWIVPPDAAASVPFGAPWGWLGYGLLLGLAGMLGDLAESLLKRDVGVKDSSSWMPGFGGVLDILDALLLSAPIAWLCWKWGAVG